MKIKLTFEQSRHLIDLGVPKEKASIIDIQEIIDDDGQEDTQWRYQFHFADLLEEVLPKEIEDDAWGFIYELAIRWDRKENLWIAGYVGAEHFKMHELINALYRLACWYYGEYLKSEEKKWEYKRILAGRGGGICQSSLERLKSEGWELDAQNGLEYTFKRKIEE